MPNMVIERLSNNVYICNNVHICCRKLHKCIKKIHINGNMYFKGQLIKQIPINHKKIHMIFQKVHIVQNEIHKN